MDSLNPAAILAVDIAGREADARVREVGSNRGPRVDEYQRVCSMRGEPWCAAFVCWCIKQACDTLKRPYPFKWDAYTPTLRRKCERISSWTHTVQRGDLFFVWSQSLGRISHVGFVASHIGDGGVFATIEGNTNAGGGREGDGVYRRKRVNSDNIIFARIPNP